MKAKATITGPYEYRKVLFKSVTLKKLRVGKYKITAKSVRLRAAQRAFVTVLPAKVKVTKRSRPTVTIKYTAPLRFKVSGAVGLALAQPAPKASSARGSASSPGFLAEASGPQLMAVNAGGTMTNAVVSGSASVSRFLISPSGTLYVLFASPMNVTTGGSGDCLLARVARGSGQPTCVDDTLSDISWQPDGVAPRNAAIQFDNAGAVYYQGYASGRTVLRRNVNGVSTDLINDAVYVNDFLVLGDGSVILSGRTEATGAMWVRRLTPQGGIQTVVSSVTSTFLHQFPDGNVYMGLWNIGNFGVRRFLTSSNQLDPKFWIAGNMGATPDHYFQASPYCAGTDLQDNYAFCGWIGSSITEAHRTTNGEVFVVVGGGSNGLLFQYYPTLAKPTTSVKKVSTAQGVFNNVVLAGLNSANQNILTMYNTASGTEVELLGAANEVEIYHINYVASSNKIMFDGLRFADNKYVLGQVDLNTMQVSIAPTGSSRLVDFQTF